MFLVLLYIKCCFGTHHEQNKFIKLKLLTYNPIICRIWNIRLSIGSVTTDWFDWNELRGMDGVWCAVFTRYA